MSTNSFVIDQWEDDPDFGRSASDWPYPTRYIQSLITGDLADAVRARLGLDSHVPVYIVETVISGGWSEYTQQNDYSSIVEAGGHTVDLGATYYGNGLESLLSWLDALDATEEG